ncbi:hypothetical protein [Burkholderia sp. ISTR5]|uniref:hypothetical protein n=1 Tax=Burkholderia sp. ISTR5 TaxID=2500161 RepID=UPI0013719C1F|nr:hypothetical protein [Burkholderia sp. ISTR5]NBI47304.1 hypothetical protein [Burkholderia sp. ISTR5]
MKKPAERGLFCIRRWPRACSGGLPSPFPAFARFQGHHSMIPMQIPRILSRVVLALTGAMLIAAVPARAAPLSPSQTTELLLALFVNGDLARGQQYNDTMRGIEGGRDVIDVQAYAQARAENPRHLAERLTESMPPAQREVLSEPLRAMFAAVADAIAHSRCRVTGETREAESGGDGPSSAQVAYVCEVANLAPVMERLRVVMPRQVVRSEQAAVEARAAMATKLAEMIPGAPIELPVSGTLQLSGSDLEGWRATDPGTLLETVSTPILETLDMPTQMRGD